MQRPCDLIGEQIFLQPLSRKYIWKSVIIWLHFGGSGDLHFIGARYSMTCPRKTLRFQGQECCDWHALDGACRLYFLCRLTAVFSSSYKNSDSAVLPVRMASTLHPGLMQRCPVLDSRPPSKFQLCLVTVGYAGNIDSMKVFGPCGTFWSLNFCRGNRDQTNLTLVTSLTVITLWACLQSKICCKDCVRVPIHAGVSKNWMVCILSLI